MSSCRLLLVTALAAAPLSAQAPVASTGREAALIANTRQLTFEGRRAGEGYYSRDGQLMVFQSEREKGNPFYQIYLMDLETGDVERVSPGYGKTTCSWVHPDNRHVLYASTHLDPESRALQKAELDFRASGRERRYSWDYDEHFDLFAWDRDTKQNVRLTTARGYDAEGSYSPDGQWICFSSNRAAYKEELSADDQKRLGVDPSVFLDLYMMRADGSELRRLTDVRGYDGGPFFSHDGTKVCWRRFSENGVTAEVWTMNVDGSDQRQLTELQAMSWAPYFHPSGEYLIFTTNVHGFANFELYLVDAAGEKEPVRVTETAGFDGLPTFSPDGSTLAWTSTRTADGEAQIFVGSWNHQAALDLLAAAPARADAQGSDGEVAVTTAAPVCEADLRQHVEVLCGDAMAGRLTGSRGEKLATQYVAERFAACGLEPAGDDGGWFQVFDARMQEADHRSRDVQGRNVLGVIRGPTGSDEPPLIIGAHVDHLGRDGGNYSHAPQDQRGQLHTGADDNASGVAGLLEIAEYLSDQKARGKLPAVRDVYFAAWSGEEIGIFGSKHFVAALQQQLGVDSLTGAVCAYLNLDMIGRMRDQLILSGAGSSPAWAGVVERRNAPIGLPVSLVDDVQLRTDTSAFYPAGVPILNAFTGAHEDYHTPGDTTDKLDYTGMQKTARLMALIARGLSVSTDEPEYTVLEVKTAESESSSGGRPYLGTIPDYGAEGDGVLLDGTAEGGPAWDAGVRGGDTIVELAGMKISDIYAYVDALEQLTAGVTVKIVVVRDGERLTFDIVPGRRG